ncbi:type III secretion system inner membrane ring lipoprotein SctJ [Vibrio sp. TBV020]|uniref:type III secretion system inner membrane ring lipoprotein SctJ n=1 Tax=Vibrio sp. TBV020 TaxID=3137398 RepID=UPI0038CD5473
MIYSDKEKRNIVFSKIAMVCITTLLVIGCKEEMYSNLSETEANQMLTILLNNNIHADKKIIKGQAVTLRVEQSQFANAVELLKQSGYPRQRFATVEQLFPQDGLVATPTQEKARFEYALSQSLAETLTQFDGVISARVHLVIPEKTRVRTKLNASAAVFVKHTQNAHISQLTPQIKSLIQGSIEGLKYDSVRVVLVETSNPPPNVQKVDQKEDSSSYIALSAILSLITLTSIYLFILLRKQKKLYREVIENVTQQ